MFNELDRGFMRLALREAEAALAVGDYPVGAALTVDGVLWDVGRNALFSEKRHAAHAEHTLLNRLSSRMWAHFREKPGAEICLYTTLEPCLMCLGTAVLHKVTRIVVACPDPIGGTTALDYTKMGWMYPKYWPQIDSGLYREESCNLIIKFLQSESAKIIASKDKLADFQNLQATWQAEANSSRQS